MVRVQGIFFASLVVSAGAVPAFAQDAPTPLSPVPLFTQMCTAGGGHLSKDSVREVSYPTLSQEARQAVGFGGPKTGLAAYEEMHLANVPNRILQVGGRAVYLFLPAPGRPGAMATSCAVVWKGNDFATARTALYTISAMRNAPADADFSPIQDAHYVEVGSPNFMLSAVEISGWTMLREGPASSESPADTGPKIRQTSNGETIVTSH